MGTRVPVQNYHDLRSANSYLEGSLNDLNAADSRPPGDIDGISEVDREAVSEGSLDHDADSHAVEECIHGSYRNTLALHGVGLEEDRSSLESNGSLAGSFNLLTTNDVSPIETTRARFLQLIVDHFISQHVIQVNDSDIDYPSLPGQDKSSKRKPGEVKYEGDPHFVLPLMYVANMYETLVNEVNARLTSLHGFHEKTVGVALEAAGGLYRYLAKKFPRKGPSTFKRRELATSLETRTRFPELVVQEEKRVRFVVVNGLDIVEKPDTVPVGDAEWFKRLTGRNGVSISTQDYKFYSPRHKYRRAMTSPLQSIPGLPAYPGTDSSSPMASPQTFRSVTESQNQPQASSKHHMSSSLAHQPQFHPVHHSSHRTLHHIQHQPTPHFSHEQQCLQQQCLQPSRLADITHANQSSTISHNLASVNHPLAQSHGVGRLHMLPTSPAKFCDECGSPYYRETSKFCSECGTKRLGI